jgi:hypothetical protein
MFGVRQAGPRFRLTAAPVSLVVLTILVAACSGTAQSQATTVPTTAPSAAPATASAATPASTEAPTPTPTLAPTPSPTPAPVTVTLNAAVYYMGYDIKLGTAAYDPNTAKLTVDATFTNHASADGDLLLVVDNNQVAVNWNGQVIPMGTDPSASTDAPGGTTVKSGFNASVPNGFTFTGATMTFGLSSEHQSIVPLQAGAAVTTEMPVDFPVSGSVTIGNMAKVTFKSGQVAPVTCSGDPDKIAFGPAKKDVLSVLLSVTEADVSTSGDTITYSHATGPDGISAQGTPGGRYMGSLATFRDDVLCYTVSAPASGKYTLAWTAERTTAKATFGFTIP